MLYVPSVCPQRIVVLQCWPWKIILDPWDGHSVLFVGMTIYLCLCHPFYQWRLVPCIPVGKIFILVCGILVQTKFRPLRLKTAQEYAPISWGILNDSSIVFHLLSWGKTLSGLRKQAYKIHIWRMIHDFFWSILRFWDNCFRTFFGLLTIYKYVGESNVLTF